MAVMYLVVESDVKREASLTAPVHGPLVVRQLLLEHREV